MVHDDETGASVALIDYEHVWKVDEEKIVELMSYYRAMDFKHIKKDTELGVVTIFSEGEAAHKMKVPCCTDGYEDMGYDVFYAIIIPHGKPMTFDEIQMFSALAKVLSAKQEDEGNAMYDAEQALINAAIEKHYDIDPEEFWQTFWNIRITPFFNDRDAVRAGLKELHEYERALKKGDKPFAYWLTHMVVAGGAA